MIKTDFFLTCATGTMYKKHKWFSGLRSFRAFNQLRQICDLTGLFENSKFVSKSIFGSVQLDR